ncbi:MAG: agmatinase, partial [Actinomycetota bacterium]|nr:agmatinase [Actinomycetota bacterium]
MRVNSRGEPAYAGVLSTFDKLPYAVEAADLEGADVAIVGAPMDDLVTYRPGTRFGPREIRLASDAGDFPQAWHMDLGIDPYSALEVVDHGDAVVRPGDPHGSHQAIRELVATVLAAGCIPVILGGDHSIAYPDISALMGHHPSGSVAVVQFDTHTDTATENWGVEWSHGTPFRNLVDDGVIPGERLIQVGLRGYWPFAEEFAWARDAGVHWHRMAEVTERGIGPVTDDVLAQTADAEHLFLSVDVDVLDPAFAPGTGTPEPGGMTTRELLGAVRRLARERSVAGVEVVEVSPPYDQSGITAMAAHRVVLETLSALALR